MLGPTPWAQVLGQCVTFGGLDNKQSHRHAQCFSQPIYNQDRWVALSAFDLAQIIQRNIRIKGERFLRHIAAKPQPTYIETDLPENVHTGRQTGCALLFYALSFIE